MKERRFGLKRCKWCRQYFSPRARKVEGQILVTAHCSWACSQETVRHNAKGKPLAAAVAGRKAKALERWKVRLEADFGPLSEREVKLLKLAHKQFYQEGYNAGYATLAKKTPEQAA